MTLLKAFQAHIMVKRDLNGLLWEAAGGVTTASDMQEKEFVYALPFDADYTKLDIKTAFPDKNTLEANRWTRIDVPHKNEEKLSGRIFLNGTFPYFFYYDALGMHTSYSFLLIHRWEVHGLVRKMVVLSLVSMHEF